MKTKMEGFTGFPAGRLPTTPVPNSFFAELLPLIDNLAELKVTLHLLWVVGRKRGRLRYARLSELQADKRLLSGLDRKQPAAHLLLKDALERAVARGTLLHATVHRGDAVEEWYMINGPHGREVIEKLHAGELDLLADLAEDVQLQMDRPNIFTMYEQNIGLLTPMIAEELRDAERQYPPEWIKDAFHEAVTNNKRNWRYVLRILERWRAEGRGPAGPDAVLEDSAARKRRYIPEGYEDLVKH
jgi:DNA replication protein